MPEESPFPVTALARSLQARVVALFDVTEVDAQSYAAELAAVAEGWGDSTNIAQIDWDHRIMKDIGMRRCLTWRSDQQRLSFIAGEQQKQQAYENFVSTSRSSAPRIF